MMRAHGGIAWLNVNRELHYNKMHFHDPERLSAVYFVSAGAVSSRCQPAGHLLFRGGRSGLSSQATHSFIAVTPEPGSLWLFPGAVPHCVLPFAAVEAVARPTCPREDGPPRISIAFNLLADAPLPQHQPAL